MTSPEGCTHPIVQTPPEKRDPGELLRCCGCLTRWTTMEQVPEAVVRRLLAVTHADGPADLLGVLRGVARIGVLVFESGEDLRLIADDLETTDDAAELVHVASDLIEREGRARP